MNGLMAIPNLICLILLNKDIAVECFDYQKKVIKSKSSDTEDLSLEREVIMPSE
jgi:AGCS family alanine or glycine:cation symporter